MLSSPNLERLDHRNLDFNEACSAFTRVATRSLAHQPKLTLSVGFSMLITLHAATQARRLLAFTAVGLPSHSESHPMDHDSISSGHTKSKDATPDGLHDPGRTSPISTPEPMADLARARSSAGSRTPAVVIAPSTRAFRSRASTRTIFPAGRCALRESRKAFSPRNGTSIALPASSAWILTNSA